MIETFWTSEGAYKILLGVLMALYIFVRRYALSSLTFSSPLIRWHERREKAIYTLVMLSWVPVVLYTATPLIDACRYPLPTWLRWCGALLVLCGNVGFFLAHRELGKNWSLLLEIRRDQSLVTTGVYRFIRHPMYAALFLIAFGASLMSANWLVSIFSPASIVLLYFDRVRLEEDMMLKHFGVSYHEYMEKTGRLLPNLRRQFALRRRARSGAPDSTVL